jgi:DNA polymerase II large subunit
MPNNFQQQLDQLKQDLQALNEEVYRNNFTGSQDFNKYSRFNAQLKVPTVAATPSTCEIGEVCVVSGTGKLYVCSASNTWSLVGLQS